MWARRGGCPGRPPPSFFPLPPLQSPDSEELPCSSENSRENLLHQAMQNSGIVLERVAGEESTLEPAPPSGSSPQSLGDGLPELPLLKVEQIETTVGFCSWRAPLMGRTQCLLLMGGEGGGGAASCLIHFYLGFFYLLRNSLV